MISQRNNGLRQAFFLCQLSALLAALGLAMAVAFGSFTGAAIQNFRHFPIYAAVLIAGFTLEVFNRREDHGDLLNRNFLSQLGITLRQTFFLVAAVEIYRLAAKDTDFIGAAFGLFAPLLFLTLFATNRWLPGLLARRVFGGVRRERVLLIGSSARARNLRLWLCHKAMLGLEPVGLLSDEEEESGSIPDLPRLGRLADLEQVLTEHQVNDAILLGLPDDAASHERMVDLLEDHGVRILILSDLEEKLKHQVVHFKDDGYSFVTTRQEPLENPLSRLAKRILDLVIALPAAIILLPPAALVVWALQRLQSPGPLLYRQRRVGFQNHQFEITKFRTMHVIHPDTAGEAPRDDARVFPAGRWLRRFGIDQLPQLINVLKGEMSLVGPRPHLVEHDRQFARQMKKYHIRALVKPGMAGLAQMRGFRGETSSPDDIRARLESDISYLEDWRLTLDLLILFQTALQLFYMAINSLLQKKKAVAALRQEGRYQRGENPAAAAYEPYALRRKFQQILGVRFFTGSAIEAVELGMQGGLVVAPAASALIGVAENPVYRASVVSSDLAITDSGMMALAWKLITGERITRVSGLEFLNLLLDQPQVRRPGATFWVMPNAASMERNLNWLASRGFSLTGDDCYIAPNYQDHLEEIVDLEQLETIRKRRPAHIIIAIGGGVQERLGAELRRNLDYRPSIYCLGAAIGFLSGDQVRIPMWADQCRLGWLFRCCSEPKKFLPRYWEARKLLGLMLEHQGRLPAPDA